MTRFEYARLARLFDGNGSRLTWVGPDGHEARLSEVRDVVVALNGLGADGWELVAVTERADREWYHLKRQAAEAPVSRAW